LITLVAIFGGYFLAPFIDEWLPSGIGQSSPRSSETGQNTPSARQPWYRSQPLAPTLIKAPDAPIFPEPAAEPGEGPVRPYEEALPQEIYEQSATPAVTTPHAAEPTPQDLPPWRQYAAVVPPPTVVRPLIALVIDDMGVDKVYSAQVIGLKGPLTLSFLAYASDLDRQAATASAAGHELLVHLSMEPGNARLDPGPNVLLSGLEPTELRRRIRWGLSRFKRFVGINNHMGSKFTADTPGMTVVMEELKRRGLLFLDSRTTSKTVGAFLAARMGIPYGERNIFLDNVNDVGAVNARLAELEKLAARQGYAIAIGHPRKATLDALSAWLPELDRRGFTLVPLTAVVRIGGTAG
jgi:polysaccharide deacetylase 2 family uncharacterized protein YibQ